MPAAKREMSAIRDATKTPIVLSTPWETIMTETPNTIGVLLLFAVIFLGCILWATRGRTATSDPEEEDVGMPGKTS
jgi:hypothetical protein